jgi:hypothetical protein
MVNKRRYRSAVTETKQQRLCYLIAGTQLCQQFTHVPKQEKKAEN